MPCVPPSIHPESATSALIECIASLKAKYKIIELMLATEIDVQKIIIHIVLIF